MARGEGKKPDWSLSAMDPDNICKGKVGAGWNNDDGSINIKLNPFVTLEAIRDVRLRLFPVEGYEERQRQRQQPDDKPPAGKPSAGKFDDLEDDIPF